MGKVMTKQMLQFKSIGLQYDGKQILEDISFELHEEEIVALIGKSGSGKSTILRIMAELIEPSSGEVRFFNEMKGEKMSMVFQNFALLPWLTVEENIAMVLESRKISREQIQRITDDIIHLIGLNGYEMAYPKELSGGMKQRVGIARAMAVEPEIMLMDEPFSALDILTANTLKGDLIDLWMDNKIPLKSILIVTHNIEEAVMLADKILILSSNPGKIISEIKIDLPRPRNPKDINFIKYVDQVYSYFVLSQQSKGKSNINIVDIYYKVPAFFSLYGLLEFIGDHSGKIAISQLESKFNLDISDMLSALHFVEVLRFATAADNNVFLTNAGKMLVESDIQQRKKILAEHLMAHLPIISYIYSLLKERPNNSAPRERFLILLEDHLSTQDAFDALNSITHWGRYAELFFYNVKTGKYYLESSDD
jgi:NitT/TauT family transport system ATP-binding protein